MTYSEGRTLYVLEVIVLCSFLLSRNKRKNQRKIQGCVFQTTTALPLAKGQKLATLKQSALLYAQGNTYASRPKNEAEGAMRVVCIINASALKKENLATSQWWINLWRDNSKSD
jgi:hypothetical protein